MGKKRRRNEVDDEEEPPQGCGHYDQIGDLPWDAQKYYHQRYSIFSRYDEGIWMTEDAWFEVTPEPVANKIAEHLAAGATPEKTVVIDAFGGVGGNAIAFAASGRWERVIAIEKDNATLACAKHNAKIYGVEHLITWHQGDCFQLIQETLAGLGETAVVFASPPWGGPGYSIDQVFDLSKMQPYGLQDLLGLRELTNDLVLYLPRSSDVRQIAAARDGQDKVAVTHYCMAGASKALCAYFGKTQVRQTV